MYKLIKGDCTLLYKNILDNDNKADLILVDPPYNRTKNHWDNIIPFDILWEMCLYLIKDNGAILFFADGMFMAELMNSNKKMWKYNLIWDKHLISGFLNAHRMPLRQHEEICVFYQKQPTYNPQFTKGSPLHGRGTKYKEKESINNNYSYFKPTDDTRKGTEEKYPTSILKFSKPHPSIMLHPTQKPVELLEYLIKTYTNEGELVIDFCAGSGSTGVAAINTNRNFIGIEKDEKYYNIAKARIEEAQINKEVELF